MIHGVSFLQIAAVIAVFQSLFLAIIILKGNKNKLLSSKYLALAVIAFSIVIFCSMLMSYDLSSSLIEYHRFIFVASQVYFLIGPFTYLYFKYLLSDKNKTESRDILHFIPFVMTLAIALWIAITKGSIVIWYFDGRIWFSISLILQNIIYSGCIIRLFRISKISIRSFFVKSDNPNMIWFRFLFCGYLFIWLLQAQFCVVWEVMKMSQYCAYTLSLYLLFAFVFFNAILYFRIEFPGIFMPRKKYEGSTLTGNEKEYYCSRLIELMENDKLYLDPDLTLGMLSGKLSIARSYLSQIINESFHVGFSDFINKYRTIESKSLLKIHNGKRNIIDIAFECGFNSKSAFNSAFKKHAGITPKEYQLQLRD